MVLSVVIVSFNTKELLRDSLISIKEAGISIKDTFDVSKPVVEGENKAVLEVWVVDNASSDGSTKMVEKEFSWVNLIKSEENVGFSKANNLAIPSCRGCYLLFLNSDTVLPKNSLPQMIKYLDENKTIGILTCKLVLGDGSLDPDCHRGFPTPWASLTYFVGLERLFPKSKLFGQYHAFYKSLTEVHEIEACAGAFMLVRKSALDEVGYWDEDFFFYGEDLDLCFRLKKNGWKVIYYPGVEVLHHKGASSGIKKSSKYVTRATRETRLKVTKASVEAMRIFYQKHYKDKYPIFVGVLVQLGIFILKNVRLLGVYLDDIFES